MKTKISIIITFFLLVFLTSCVKTKKYDIVVSMFPPYDIANNIVGDNLTITMLSQPGVEIHDFSPSSRHMKMIKDSKLFIFTSYKIETWLNNDSTSFTNKDSETINLSNYVTKNIESDHHDHDDHDHDQHFWTDPLIYISLIDVVKNQIIKIDPSNKDYYETNALTYKEKIMELHNILKDKVDTYLLTNDELKLFFAGHNGLSYFASLYNLDIIAISESNKPDSDLVQSQIKNLITEIKINNSKYLFTEELSDLKVANTIKNELAKEGFNIILQELHSYHNVTKNDFNAKVTYYDLFKRNIDNISRYLGDNNE